MFAPICVVALGVHRRFIRQIRRACCHKPARRFVLRGMAGVNMNVDGALLTLSTGPAVYIVLGALERDTINDTSQGSGMSVLSVGCRRVDSKVEPSRYEGNMQPKWTQPLCGAKHRDHSVSMGGKRQDFANCFKS